MLRASGRLMNLEKVANGVIAWPFSLANGTWHDGSNLSRWFAVDVGPRLWASRGPHADARLRADAGSRDGGVREELAAGAVLRSGGRSAVKPRKTFARSELYGVLNH